MLLYGATYIKGGYTMDIKVVSLIAVISSTVILQSMLYFTKKSSVLLKIAVLSNVIFSLSMAWVYWMSLPLTWTMQATFSVCYGLWGVCTLVLWILKKTPINLIKLMLSVSTFGSLAGLLT